MTMPNAVNLRKRLAVLLGRSNYSPVEQVYHAPGPWRGHVREYTLDEIVWIVEADGWSPAEADPDRFLEASRDSVPIP